MPDPDPVALLAFVKDTFSWEELKTLCFQLYVPFDDLPGEGREAKARELIAYMQNRGRLPDLTAALARERPEQYRRTFGATPQPQPRPKAKSHTRNPRQVFISHAHQDAKLAHKLAGNLRREGYAVWIAPDSIEPGEQWVSAINRGLSESGIFLLLLTPESVSSEWVREETDAAIMLEKQKKLRFLIAEVRPAEALPLWANRQYIPFRSGFRPGLNRLLAVLRGTTAAEQPAPPVSKTETPAAPPKTEPVPEPKLEPATQKATPAEAKPQRSPQPAAKPPAGSSPAKPGRMLYWLLGALGIVAVTFLGWRLMAGGPGGDGANGAATPSPEATSVLAGLPTPPLATRTPAAAPTRTPTFSATPTATATPTLTPTASTTPTPQAGDIRTVNRGGVEVEQVYVPAGSFMMGSEDGDEDERPVHEVTLDAFWLDRTEVTNAQFAAFVADTGYETTAERIGSGHTHTENGWKYTEGADWRHPQGPDSDLTGLDEHPVVLVSWDDAKAYAEWAGGRLPTEAEWEYAARGPESLIYPWGDVFVGNRLNFCDRNCPFSWAEQNVDDGYAFTAPAGSYENGASWVGALDMAGNVWEWVNDRYAGNYYARSPEENPKGPDLGTNHALRGGAWNDNDLLTRAACRVDDNPLARLGSVGFRVAEHLSDPDP